MSPDAGGPVIQYATNATAPRRTASRAGERALDRGRVAVSSGVAVVMGLRLRRALAVVDHLFDIGVSSAGNSRTFAGPPVRDRKVALLLKESRHWQRIFASTR